MTGTEFWLTYHLASRCTDQPTTQLIELGGKLCDLEDILDFGMCAPSNHLKLTDQKSFMSFKFSARATSRLNSDPSYIGNVKTVVLLNQATLSRTSSRKVLERLQIPL